MNNRIVICVAIWWHRDKVDFYTFYEPDKDLRNDVTSQELEKMLDKNILIEYTPKWGRKL